MSQPTPEQVHVDTYGEPRKRKRKETDVDPIAKYEELVKAKYDTKQLEALKGKGHTLPGTTSYPIDDDEDLANAIKAVGRGKVAGHDKIRQYVAGRARAMGKASAIPSTWGSDGSLAKAELELTVDIWKADHQQIVYGVVLEPDLVDSQGDIVSADEIEKAAHGYLIESRKNDVQHDEVTKGADGLPLAHVVESYVAPHDMILHGRLVKRGAWVMGVKVNDPATWEQVTKGDLTGFSIGGNAVRVPEAA